MGINTFVLGLLAILVRAGLLMVFGAIGLTPLIQAYINENVAQWQQLSLAIAGVIVTVGYALYKKFVDKQKLVQALAEAGMTEKGVEMLVASKTTVTPSVLTPKTQVPG